MWYSEWYDIDLSLAMQCHVLPSPDETQWLGRAMACYCTCADTILTHMKLESTNLVDFLLPTRVIDSDTPAIRGKALELAADLEGDIDQARALFEWVRDAIPHSWDIQSRTVTCKASEVLDEGTGICFAKSHLLAALLRAAGIPAGLCYQQLRRDPDYGDFTLHGLNAVYLDSREKWVRVDPRGNIPGVNAQFSLDEESLAWPSNAEAGEFIHETVFVDADPAVVEFLESSDDLLEHWADLPSKLKSSLT